MIQGKQCENIPKLPEMDLPVVNGKKLCGRRDESFNFLKMHHPSVVNGKFVCEGNFDLCSDDPTNTKMHAFCVPPDSKCPITSISYDANVNLVVSRDSNLGMPLVDLKLSQGGAPCAKEG